MRNQWIKIALWLHTMLTFITGLCLYLLPKSFSPMIWPWELPPLASRFMGSLLIGGAVCTALAALGGEPLPVEGPALLGLGDLLIVSVGLLDIEQTGLTPRMLVWVAAFLGTMVLLWALLPLRGRRLGEEKKQWSPSRGLHTYFVIHLCAVIPVGLTMYLLPELAQRLWPWSLSIVNVRLLGAFFVGASILSIWSVGQRSWKDIRPILGLYAVFTTLATLASIIHFNLFNPERMMTWLFFALYLFVAIGAWYFLGAGFLKRDVIAAT